MTLGLGDGEFALRLISFSASLVSLPLAWIAARRMLPASGALLAFALVALNGRLIYYAGELKQYESDVVVALVALLALSGPILRPAEDPPSRRRLLGSLALGIGLQLVSHAAIIVLAGLGSAIVLGECRRGKHRFALRWCLVGAGWVAAFAALYAAFYHHGTSSDFLLAYWQSAFAAAPTTVEGLRWYPAAAERLSATLLRVSPPGLGTAAVLLGVLWFARSSRRRLLAIASMFPFLWVASLLKAYPLADRLLLFSAPMLLILAAGSLAWVGFEGQAPRRRALWIIAATCLVAGPARSAFRDAARPISLGDPTAVLKELERLAQPGDTVIAVGPPAQAPLEYYASRSAVLRKIKAVRTPRPEALAAAAARFVGRPRVWLLQSPLPGGPRPQALIDVMAAQGTILESREGGRYFLTLFDMRIADRRRAPTAPGPGAGAAPRPQRVPPRK